jgi:hypothetical protein
VDVYTVSTSVDKTRDNYPPSKWLADKGWPFPVVVDSTSQEAARALGLRFFPTTVFVNSDGVVVLRVTGIVGIDNLLAIFAQLS